MQFFTTYGTLCGYQSSTFPEFKVTVNASSLENCSMRMVLVYSLTGEVKFTKNCDPFSENNKVGFRVVLDSNDTKNLCGTYMAHFILTGNDGLEFNNLVVPIEILRMPKEES